MRNLREFHREEINDRAFTDAVGWSRLYNSWMRGKDSPIAEYTDFLRFQLATQAKKEEEISPTVEIIKDAIANNLIGKDAIAAAMQLIPGLLKE